MAKPNFPSDAPMDPATATEVLRTFYNEALELLWTNHAKEQMSDRGLIMSDVLHILKFGFVFKEGKPATLQGYFKYKIQSTTPNSNGRTVTAIVIPGGYYKLKVVTVYWKD
ncbi:DUF4258 domain-containing protein [Emcibacter sp.]|uniref:DUF4258 domain-containing protein n=1 Tax=Emcibacter sp. TaxID=1979954 RepID=UPI003A91848B